MLFKSIKWRLQVWYGLILVFVLAGFGFTAYQLERGRQMRRIDAELQRRMGMIATLLHPPPPRGPDFRGHPFGAPPPDEPLDEGPPDRRFRTPEEFHLPPQAAGLFGSRVANSFYFAIFRNGKEFAGSTNQPNATVIQTLHRLPISANGSRQIPAHDAKPPPPQTFGKFREMFRRLPSGEIILVGCSIAPESKELRRTAGQLTAVGAGILLLGLAGGWWLVGRAIRPINDISAAAVKISAGDLSQRINAAETGSELGRLAAVLNSTFARLETVFAQQRQFAADAAHELRTPVTVMLTQTQTALNRERVAAEYRETVEACQRSAQRMRRLIESLMELARLDAGQETLKRTSFDLAQLARDGVESIRPLAEERDVKVHCELPSVACVGDAERLAQVVSNLLANAVQYNREKGEVRATTQLQNGMAVFTVTDMGPGIPAADLPHIFERFYRADKSRSSSHAGLGLAITKAIVEAHGGTIEVSSEENVGTTFIVRLPM